MCGITGIVNLDGGPPVTAGELRPMIAQLRHRGPDGEGLTVDRGLVGLGHTRLAIIDPRGGRQPMQNEDGSVRLAFNGELFNHRELRRELEGLGYSFRTRSDTEVLLRLYEAYGEAFAERINGQVAAAVWDGRRRRLLLLRDRVGIVPLYYMYHRKRLLFGSEIKALLAATGSAPVLDPLALDQIFTFWAPLAPTTAFRGVCELPPGEMMIVEPGRVRRERWWDWQFGQCEPRGEQELAEELHQLLADSVRLRLQADVPVGGYLSGGLDSSAIAALTSRAGARLCTFSVGFEQSDFDEREFQRAVAAALGTRHEALTAGAGLIREGLPDVLWHTETPLLRTAPVPLAALSRRVRETGHRVVLTGEGADEVFGGYDLFKEYKIRAFWARRADSSWRCRLLERLYPYLGLNRQGSRYLAAFFGQGLDQPGHPFFSHLPRWHSAAMAKRFFSEATAERAGGAMESLLERLPDSYRRWNGLQRAQYLEAKLLLPGYLLSSQGDRMMMANGIEGRFPFLDHRVIEFGNRLPSGLKLKVLREKYLLRRAMEGLLPRMVGGRTKQPYRAPDLAAFSGNLPSYAADLLAGDTVSRYGYFDRARVDRLVSKVRSGRAVGQKDSMAFVGVLTTQLWHYLFIERYHSRFGAGEQAASAFSRT